MGHDLKTSDMEDSDAVSHDSKTFDSGDYEAMSYDSTSDSVSHGQKPSGSEGLRIRGLWRVELVSHDPKILY